MSQLGAFLENLVAQKRQDGQKASVLRKALTVYDPDNKDQYTAMGLTDLEGTVQGLGMKRQKSIYDQQQQEAMAGDMFRRVVSQVTQQGQDVTNASRLPAQALQAFGRLGIPGFGQIGNELQNQPDFQLDAEGLARLGLQTGAIKPTEGVNALSRIQAAKTQTEDDGVKFTQDPVTGKRFATHGKILSESGIDPAFASAPLAGGAVPMKDETGNTIGYNIPIGGGKFKPMANKDLTDAQKQNLILQHQKAKSDLLGKLTVAGGNTNIVNAINDEMATHDDAIGQLKGGKAAAAATPTSAAPKKITTKADYDALDSGTLYIGKDGKSYRKP